MSEIKSRVISNASRGYNYSYASLADFVKQDVSIPLMRVKVLDGKQFMEWLDEATGQWFLGAEIVDMGEKKGMNPAQRYGASLTYARRYTTAMARMLATDDDSAVEKLKADDRPKEPTPASKKQLAMIAAIVRENGGDPDSYIEHIGGRSGKLTSQQASKVIETLQAAAKKKQELAQQAEAKSAAEADQELQPISADDIPFEE